MLITELWKDYLTIINTMAAHPGIYGLDEQREKVHEKLYLKYSEQLLFKGIIKERFDEICHSLDTVIDFVPPIERYDSINVYVKAIDHYMLSKGRLYVIGHIDKR